MLIFSVSAEMLEQLGVVSHACNSSTQEVEVGR